MRVKIRLCTACSVWLQPVTHLCIKSRAGKDYRGFFMSLMGFLETRSSADSAGLKERIRGGDNVWMWCLSPILCSGTFLQTMTQSLDVAYFQLLLIRSCVKQDTNAQSKTGNVTIFPSK